MSSWRLRYSLVPGVERSYKSSSWLFLALAFICFLYLSIIFVFDTVPQGSITWNTENLRKKFVLNGSLTDLVHFQVFGSKATEPAGHRIAVVMVVTNQTKPENYDIAIQTVRCYCKIHDYEFVLAVDTDFNCAHRDKFFRRHCAAAKILPLFDTILFLDADIGVVNPERRMEDYMVEGIDVTFYDRFYNWEIMAGSYIARNTQYAIDLLNEFADYEFKLPRSFHGTDNGALHIFLAERLFPHAQIETNICKKVYNKSNSFQDLFTYEACVRAIFGAGTDFGKVRIMRKGTGWARDGWLTSMLWHPDIDFMFHGWKTNQLRQTPEVGVRPNQMGRSEWYNPLGGPIYLERCSPQNKTWSYDPRLHGNKEDILSSLRKFEEEVAVQQGTGWVRDAWLTSGVWNPEHGFMLHGWKTKQLIKTPMGRFKATPMNWSTWYNPFAGPIDLDKCVRGNTSWSYNPQLVQDKKSVEESLLEYEKKVAFDKIKQMGKIFELANRK
ncbi:Protein CBG18974 [Caenorhabditis briggsae]|uniref:Protein CBG18974 n=1 Tax=Caenorhabditis briggsae TaxID=6238 RepID=A8XUH0_CAEBR|nr:Protein CBG18974 [Caenorhabditis briggsae]CAP36295.2 Protein CBG18974 [Caenorhabditis briggsae]